MQANFKETGMQLDCASYEIGQISDSCEHSTQVSCSTEGGQFLDKLQTLSWSARTNPFQILTPYLLNIHFNVTLTRPPSHQRGPVSSYFDTKIWQAFLPMNATRPTHLHPPFERPKIIWNRLQITKLQFLYLTAKYRLRTLLHVNFTW